MKKIKYSGLTQNNHATENNGRTQDEELVQQFQQGNLEAFNLLVRRHQEVTLSLCYRFLNNPEDSRDAAQDIFLKVYHSLTHFKPRAQFTTWLYRITVNTCLNTLRSRKRRRWLRPFSISNRQNDLDVMNVIDPDGSPETVMEKSERIHAVQTALSALPPDQMTAIILHQYQNLSYKEIAGVMQTSVASVESRIHRARKKLGHLLKEYLAEKSASF